RNPQSRSPPQGEPTQHIDAGILRPPGITQQGLPRGPRIHPVSPPRCYLVDSHFFPGANELRLTAKTTPGDSDREVILHKKAKRTPDAPNPLPGVPPAPSHPFLFPSYFFSPFPFFSPTQSPYDS